MTRKEFETYMRERGFPCGRFKRHQCYFRGHIGEYRDPYTRIAWMVLQEAQRRGKGREAS